jgi:hypothetical protein
MTSAEWVDHLCIENLRGRWTDLFKLGSYFAAIEPGRFKVIVLDAFYRFMPADTDENDNGTLANLYNQLDRYASQLRSAFILIHHSSKGNQSDKAITDVGAGAGAQSRAADTHLILRQHEEDGAIVMDAATRSFPPIEPLCLRWTFPLWNIDPTLDPTQLRRPGSKRRKDPPAEAAKQVEEPWTALRFVQAFVSAEPLDKKVILAMAKTAGVSNRTAESPVSNPSWRSRNEYFTHARAHPPYPPEMRERIPGVGMARARAR